MDETENQKDTSQTTGDTSGGEKGTSEPKPETYTKETQAKAVSDALATAGREAKSLETRGKDLNAREEAIKAERAKITQWQKERDDVELESVRDDPEKLSLFQKTQALREKGEQLESDRATLEKDKLEHSARIQVAEQTEREIAIWEIAKEYGVDPMALKELNITDVEQLKRVAKAMGTGKAPPKAPITPDSGMTEGGVPQLSPREKMVKGFEQEQK